MSPLVSDCQGAFVPGRSMFHNIVVANEIVRGYGRGNNSPRCTIKVDMHKAFDSISWSFLKRVLHQFGFPERFIGWVMECVTTPRYSILVNGAPEGYFEGKRGLRQGDPLSPYLFVLCIEVLSRKLTVAASEVGFSFHTRCKRAKITHLAFADDLLLFCRADVSSVSIIQRCLEEFFLMSGLRANIGKSLIFMDGVTETVKDQLSSLLGFGADTFPTTYLEFPLHPSRLNRSGCAGLILRIKSFVENWMTRRLSYAGRLQLIQSVVGGVLSHWFSTAILLGRVISKIEGVCRRFLWGGDGDRRCRCPVSWDIVTLPKAEGGLGIKEALAWK